MYDSHNGNGNGKGNDMRDNVNERVVYQLADWLINTGDGIAVAYLTKTFIEVRESTDVPARRVGRTTLLRFRVAFPSYTDLINSLIEMEVADPEG